MTTKHFCDICGCQSSESGLQKISIAVFLSGENEQLINALLIPRNRELNATEQYADACQQIEKQRKEGKNGFVKLAGLMKKENTTPCPEVEEEDQ